MCSIPAAASTRACGSRQRYAERSRAQPPPQTSHGAYKLAEKQIVLQVSALTRCQQARALWTCSVSGALSLNDHERGLGFLHFSVFPPCLF